jgi:hypothetical protein
MEGHISLKRPLTLNGLRDILSQNIEHFFSSANIILR